MLKIALLALFVHGIVALRYIEVGNRNSYPIWIQTQGNRGHPALLNGQVIKLDPGARHKYDIVEGGWAGRLWPKTGCDGSGQNCEFGQSIAPCPAGGCHPPAETKVEFFFPPNGDPKASYYDISLVDGYSLGAEIVPYKDGKPYQKDSCIRTDCHVTFGACPRNERSGLGDLTAKGRNKNVVGCLAPCKKWNYPAPWGLGRSEQEGDGRMLCCPDPVKPEDCRRGIVIQTAYVKLIHQACPSAYSYSYDDLAGLHNCPSAASFVVNFYS